MTKIAPMALVTASSLAMFVACSGKSGINIPTPVNVEPQGQMSSNNTPSERAPRDVDPWSAHPNAPKQPANYFEPSRILEGVGFEQAEDISHFLAGTYRIEYHPANGDRPAVLFLRTLESAGQYENWPDTNFTPAEGLFGTFGIGGHTLMFDEEDPEDVAIAKQFLVATGFVVFEKKLEFAPNSTYTVNAAVGVAQDSKLVYGYSEDYLLAFGFSVNGSQPTVDGVATIVTNEEMKKSVVIEGAVYQNGKKISDYRAQLWSLDRYRLKR